MAKTILEHWHSSFSATSPPDSSINNNAHGSQTKGLREKNIFNDGRFVSNLAGENSTQTAISSANEIPSGRTFTILGFLGAFLGQGRRIDETETGLASNGIALRNVANIVTSDGKAGTAADGTIGHHYLGAEAVANISLNNTLVDTSTVKRGYKQSNEQGVDSVADGNLFDQPVTRGNKRVGTNETVITEWGNLTDRALTDGVINSDGVIDRTQVTDFNRFAGSELTQ